MKKAVMKKVRVKKIKMGKILEVLKIVEINYLKNHPLAEKALMKKYKKKKKKKLKIIRNYFLV